MDASLLTSAGFWEDREPFAAGDFPGGVPGCPELAGHVLFETSGSSGTPKWIALSKAALLASAAAVNRHLEIQPASCWGLALPVRHVGGFGVVARAFEGGCGLEHFPHRWDPEAFGGWLAEKGVTHTALVPTQVHDLVVAGKRAPAALRAIVVGGGHLDAGTGRAARALGWPVLASYGMTEAGSQIATQRLECLSRLYELEPLPLLPIWEAGISPEGRLRIKGPALFSGTLRLENGAWRFMARASEWHQTQDRVSLENRAITPLGRADALIKVLGELVDPEEIERELVVLSGGSLAPGAFAVIAVPDERAGHVLVPVFDAAVDETVMEAVLAGYAAQAPGFRRLGPALRFPGLPRSPLGKPRRAEILALISCQAAGAAAKDPHPGPPHPRFPS